MHDKLLESAKKFLNLATHKELPLEAKPFVESPIIIESRIDSATSHLDRMFGHSLHEPKKQEIPTNVDKELSKFSQGRINEECCGEVLYVGKSKTGVTYKISKKSFDDFQVSFERPNGGKADLASYPTAQGALYMLQAQVPNIVPEKDDITITPIVHADPIDVHSFDDLHEDTPLNKAINMILENIGVESLESLDEEKQKELISIATDLAPHI